MTWLALGPVCKKRSLSGVLMRLLRSPAGPDLVITRSSLLRESQGNSRCKRVGFFWNVPVILMLSGQYFLLAIIPYPGCMAASLVSVGSITTVRLPFIEYRNGPGWDPGSWLASACLPRENTCFLFSSLFFWCGGLSVLKPATSQYYNVIYREFVY